jgi:hypothetical protein
MRGPGSTLDSIYVFFTSKSYTPDFETVRGSSDVISRGAMRVRLKIVGLSASLLALSACSGGSTTTPSSATGAVLVGNVNDAIGDAVVLPVLRNGVLITPVVPVPSDLLQATVTVERANLTATISFAANTFSRTDTFACLMLDVDENPATGGPSAGGDVAQGYDYSVCAVLPRGSTTAQVSRLGGGAATGITSVPCEFVSANQMRFSVSLSLLGNDDGRMAFKVSAMQWVDDPVVLNTAALDLMPDIGRAAGLLR